ncbi:MAG: GNAT family N-acetyltransferase [bacterium]
MPDGPVVVNNTATSQFEIRTDGGLALLKYTILGDRIELVHTEVPASVGGGGFGSALARAALDYARAQQLRVVPTCRFVRGYMDRHHEYDDLRAMPA